MLDKVMDAIDKIEQKDSVTAIKKSFITIFPIILVGAIALLLMNFPIPVVKNFLETTLDGKIHSFIKAVHKCTFGYLSIYLVLTISYYYSCAYQLRSTTLQIMAMITSVICFMVLNGVDSGDAYFGTTGVFTSIIVPILTTKLFLWLCMHVFKRLRYYATGADVAFKNSMNAIFPVLICILVFVGVSFLIEELFQVSNLNRLISDALEWIFSKLHYGLFSGILFMFIEHFLWFFGIHGANAIDAVAQSLFVPADLDPNMIICKTFFDVFGLIGGNGTVICLVIAVLLVSKNKTNRKLVTASLSTVLFNINEIIIFGFPIVFNPFMAIPFVLVPIVSIVIAYIATIVGFLPIITRTINWTTPVFFNAYLAYDKDIRGVIVQLICIVVGVLIYIPFVKLFEKYERQNHNATIREMKAELLQAERVGRKCNLIEFPGRIGTLAKSMAFQLRSDILNKKLGIFYQPLHDKDNNIVGAEALLRWEFNNDYMYPPLVIQIAKDDDIIDDMAKCIIEICCEDCKVFKRLSLRKFTLSINITPEQLDSISFVDYVIETVMKYDLCGNIALEVTEQGSILHYNNIPDNIARLKNYDIAVCIDDFSMGHTSLKYLQNYSFDSIKLDGSLIRQTLNNPRSQEIVTSIIQLGKGLNYKVTAEYVETKEIEELLRDLGCDYFQGHLYSPAIPKHEFIDYMYLR